MEIFTKTQGGLQSAYNVIGATGLRALAAAGKIVTGFCLGNGTMMGASLAQGILAFTTSLAGNAVKSNLAIGGLIVVESAVINGLSYGNETTQAFMNSFYKLADHLPNFAKIDISTTDSPSYTKLAGSFVVDAAVEGIIIAFEQNNEASELNAGVEINIAELVINTSDL